MTHPLFNISNEAAFKAMDYFTKKNLIEQIDELEAKVAEELDGLDQ